jgi:hypothetical protein
MKPTSVSLLLFALLGGCAPGMGGEYWVFEKSDTTEAQLKLDRDECFSESVDPVSGTRGITLRVDREAYRVCMARRGYQVRKATTIAAAQFEGTTR